MVVDPGRRERPQRGRQRGDRRAPGLSPTGRVVADAVRCVTVWQAGAARDRPKQRAPPAWGKVDGELCDVDVTVPSTDDPGPRQAGDRRAVVPECGPLPCGRIGYRGHLRRAFPSVRQREAKSYMPGVEPSSCRSAGSPSTWARSWRATASSDRFGPHRRIGTRLIISPPRPSPIVDPDRDPRRRRRDRRAVNTAPLPGVVSPGFLSIPAPALGLDLQPPFDLTDRRLAGVRPGVDLGCKRPDQLAPQILDTRAASYVVVDAANVS